MSVLFMRQYTDLLASRNVGYDQGDRWSFNPQRDGSDVHWNSETDCSASCSSIARSGGIPVDTRDPMYTGNLKQKFVAAGCEAINVSGKSVEQIVATLRDGDFLLGPGHVVFAYHPRKWWSAENDERRRSSGGRAGDQTGVEARYRAPYWRSRGWQWILRYHFPQPEPQPQPQPHIHATEPRRIDYTSTDPTFVRITQEISGAAADGERGPKTIAAIKRLQARLGVQADGEFGPNTAEAYLLSLPNMYKGRGGLPSGGVKLLQYIVRSRIDGEFGGLTEADVKSCQVWAGLEPDGNAGDETKRRITI